MTNTHTPSHPSSSGPGTTQTLPSPCGTEYIGRTLHLVDLENIAGTGRPEFDEVLALGQLYRRVLAPREWDLITVGTDNRNVFHIDAAFPGCRRVTGRGADGADRALIESIEWEVLRSRFERLVIASGDHCFTGVAEEARRNGLSVNVVVGRGSLAGILGAFADAVIPLELPGPTGDFTCAA